MPEALLVAPVRRGSQDKNTTLDWDRDDDVAIELSGTAESSKNQTYRRYGRGAYSPGRAMISEGFAPPGGTQVAGLVGELAAKWRTDTLITSSMIEMVLHPSYQRIIGLGRSAVPPVLRELQKSPGQWFWALRALTGEDPAAAAPTFADKRTAWLQWGRARGYLSD